MSVPKLRFPGFTGEWEEKPLSFAIASLDAGVSVNSGEGLASDGESGVLKTSCVTLGVFDPTENKIVDQVSELKRLKEQVKAGTIIISRMNTPALVGANAYVSKNSPNLFLPDRLWAAKIKQTASSRWIALLLGHSGTRRALSDRATGTSGSMKNLTKSDVLTLPIFLPILHEQQKIAAFLGAVDAKLAALASRQVALGRFKAGLMQKLFSQQLRFTRDDGQAFPDWVEKRLGELGSFKSGVGFSEVEQGGMDGIPLYKVSDMNLAGNEHRMVRANNYVTLDQIERLKYRPICPPSLIFAKVGAAIFLERKRRAENFLLDNNMMAFTPNASISIEFSVYLFSITRLSKFAQVGALPSFNAGDVAALKVSVPRPDEQQKIANALSAMDAKIQAVADQVTRLQTYKKGLLQQMFV